MRLRACVMFFAFGSTCVGKVVRLIGFFLTFIFLCICLIVQVEFVCVSVCVCVCVCVYVCVG